MLYKELIAFFSPLQVEERILGLQKEVEGKMKENRGGIFAEMKNLVKENIDEVSYEMQALANDVQFQLDNLSQVRG